MRIELRGLSTEEQIRLVEMRLGVTEGVRQVCADLLPRVGGNPFFLLEMVDAIASQGFRPPRSLMNAIAAWVGAEDPRSYLRANYLDDGGKLRPDTPESMRGYFQATDDEYWPEE